MSSATSSSMEIGPDQKMPRMSQGAFMGFLGMLVAGTMAFSYLQYNVNRHTEQLMEQKKDTQDRMAAMELKMDEQTKLLYRIEAQLKFHP